MLLWDLFLRGGAVMWPLLLCSIAGLAIILDRFWFFFVSAREEDQELLGEAIGALASGRRLEAMQMLRKQNGPGSSVLSAALSHAGEPLPVIEEAVRRAGRAELLRMQRGLGALEAIITVAPLLGLLGTVTGIVRTFNVIGAMAGLHSPAQVAPGIAEALLTTVFGLVIAAPSVICHAIFTGQVERRVAAINDLGGQVLQVMAQGGERR